MSSRCGSPPRRSASSSPDVPGWLAAAPDGVVVRVHAQPGASRAGVTGVHGSALKVKVRARPVDGAANDELVLVLAVALAVRPDAVAIASGATGREKRVHVRGLDVASAWARLAPFVDKGGGPD
jgi:uncharacterized protein (TIGR00251 family)